MNEILKSNSSDLFKNNFIFILFCFKKKEKDETSSAASSDDENDDLAESNSSNRHPNLYNNIYRKYRKRHVWEVMEGYRDPNMKISQPENYEGVLLKRRNWPMKGWHKRYFMLVDGILSYGKSKSDVIFLVMVLC